MSVDIRSDLRAIELDIAMNAGSLINQGKIEIYDSRTFIESVVKELASNFYHKYNLAETSPREDYLELIDDFAESNLINIYGTAYLHE